MKNAYVRLTAEESSHIRTTLYFKWLFLRSHYFTYSRIPNLGFIFVKKKFFFCFLVCSFILSVSVILYQYQKINWETKTVWCVRDFVMCFCLWLTCFMKFCLCWFNDRFFFYIFLSVDKSTAISSSFLLSSCLSSLRCCCCCWNIYFMSVYIKF